MKKKRIYQFIAFVLCTIMLCSSASFMSFAENVIIDDPGEWSTEDDMKSYENLYYKIEDNQAIILDCDDDTTSVDIPSKIENYPVTTIGSNAFSYRENLTDVKIPNSVTRIEEYAFLNCYNIKNLIVPDSVSFIGNNAFGSISNIVYHGACQNAGLYSAKCLNGYIEGNFVYADSTKTEICACFAQTTGIVKIPEGVNYVYGFEHCSKITEITIPSSVYSFVSFNGESLKAINVSAKNENYSSVDGILFDKDKRELIKYPKSKNGTTYSIPDGVEIIGFEAFYNSSLSEISIPDSVKYIEYGAFENCSNLTRVKIPEFVEEIGYDAFYGCTSLTDVNIPESVEYIGYDAFCNTAYYNDKSNWDGVALYDTSNKYLLTAHYRNNEIFEFINNLQYISPEELLEELKYISELLAGSVGGEKSVKYTIKDTTKIIANGAFYNCNYLSEVIIPYGITFIPERTFANCQNLVKCIIPDSVAKIESCAFYGCISLEDVKIGKNITEIEYDAYSYCPSVEKYEVDAGNCYFSSDKYGALFNIDKTRLISFPTGNSMNTYEIPGSVENIDIDAFVGCSNLKSIKVNTNNQYYSSYEGALYNKDCTELIQIPAVGNRYTVPKGVETVYINYPFTSYPDNPTFIDIPKSVMSIYGNTDYILYEGDKEHWENNVGYDYGCCNVLFEKYGADLNELNIEQIEEKEITLESNNENAFASCLNTLFNEPVKVCVNDNRYTKEDISSFEIPVEGKNMVAYDIAIVNTLGGPVTNYNGTVKIHIAAPAETDEYDVYHITHNGDAEFFSTGNKVDESKKITIEEIDGKRYLTFSVESWSPFIITWDKEEQQPTQVPAITVCDDFSLNYKASGKVTYTTDYTSKVKSVEFNSSNSSVVSVDNNGNVKGAKSWTKGTATITCTVTFEDGKTASDSCNVTCGYTWWQWIIGIVLFGWIWY